MIQLVKVREFVTNVNATSQIAGEGNALIVIVSVPCPVAYILSSFDVAFRL